MIHLTRGLIRRWLDRLLHIEDTPERTASAFALGVFLGFSPLLGFHTALGVLLAFILDLNRVAVLLGVYSNLPWIIAAYYTSATMVGAFITRTPLPPRFPERIAQLFEHSLVHREFWRQLWTLMSPLVGAYAVGSLIGASIVAAIAYPLALGFVRSERRLRGIMHKRH